MALTRRQSETLSFIQQFLGEHGYSPSLREIAQHLGLRSVATAHQHVQALVGKGLVAREWNRTRAIDLVDDAGGRLLRLPLLGAIPASPPAEAYAEQDEQVEVPRSLVGVGEHFGLSVSGDSMIEAGIHDGDIVIVRRQPTANDGDTVAVLLDDRVTLKRLRRRAGHVLLEPANAAMQPIEVRSGELVIQGVVVALLRKYAMPA